MLLSPSLPAALLPCLQTFQSPSIRGANKVWSTCRDIPQNFNNPNSSVGLIGGAGHMSKASPERKTSKRAAQGAMFDEKLKRMAPSVQCSDDEMTLKVKRVSPMHFLVDSGEKPLTPLAGMSSKCGFSMKRSRRDVQFAASYQGCHVTQQGGEYILPLRLWGAPMAMSCPALLPSPSVFCFPSGMVVKIVGITANDLNVKVSSTWTSLSAACISCGFIVEVFSGGLTLTAPYNRGFCVEMKDNEYLLTLLWTDVELLVTCPSIPNIKPTMATVTLPSTTSGGLLSSLYSQLLGFSLPTSTQSPPSTVSTMAPFLRPRYLSAVPASMKANAEGLPSDELSSFSFISQYAPYLMLPRSDHPTQSSTTKSTATVPTLPELPKSPRYAFSVFPQRPLLPGNFGPTTASPFPATPTQASVATSALTSEPKEKNQVPEQIEFPYPFLPFLRGPPPPKDQGLASGDTKPEIQIPELPQLLYPRTYHIPVLYPQTKHPPEKQNSQTTALTTTPTTTTDTPKKPAAQLAFYHPHTFMQVYYLPQQAALPVLPDPPTTSATNTAPPDQHERQPISRALPPLYPFLSHEKLKTATRIW
uniref:Uncharacterized LOC114463705 n=1 Tax=Gouania willdenowi TaxID=441366 RepID=A0A8C5NGX8_GOUWI